MEYQAGEEVAIVKGLYKRYKTGTYRGPYGTKMCSVKVNGVVKNIRLSSIKKLPPSPNAAEEGSTTITINRAEYGDKN